MATMQDYRLGIYEGILYIFAKASEAMEPGDVVTLDTTAGEPFVKKCGTAEVPFGYAAQLVTTAGVADYEPGGLVSHTAKVGDTVGVYICGGLYKLQADDMDYGDEVYAVAGKLSTVASTSEVKVGIVTSETDADGFVKVKSYL